MRIYDDMHAFYFEKWGEPTGEFHFSNRYAEMGVLKWDPSEVTSGVALYATLGGSNYPLPGYEPSHRQEFYVGLLPAADEVAGPLAKLAAHARVEGKVLDHGHFYRHLQPIIDETIGLNGFFLLSSFDDNGELDPPVILADGRHVDLFMAVPAFTDEIDFGLEHGVDDLWSLILSKDVPFWAPHRESALA